MFCAISGEPPQHPVVSAKSGHLYEKRLILKYLADNASKDPITGEELDAERDLIEVKNDPKVAAPRPPQFTSIPSLLQSLQNEYDSIIFEMLTLKKQYDNIRQELSSALYTNDAANRVIARLMRERDEAREALANVGASLGTGGAAAGAHQDTEMADAPSASALPQDVAADIDATAQRLSSERKPKSKRKAPAGYATAAEVPAFTQVKSLPSMHSTKPPGVTALALSSNGNLAVTGGADKQVQIFDRTSDQVVSTLKGHTKKITRVAFQPAQTVEVGAEAAGALPAPSFAASASEDRSARIWQANAEGKFSLAHVLSDFKDVVTGLDFHPNGFLLGVASRDSNWALFDVSSGKSLLFVSAPAAGSQSEEDAEGGYAYESLAFHPDGQLVATGTKEGIIRIWDVKSAGLVTTFRAPEHAGKAVNSLGFSENGYYLASAAAGSNVVQVWDLRKLTVAGTIDAGADAAVSDVRFDPSAQFLAVVGTDAKIFANKSWNLLYTFDGNTAQITSAAWDAKDGSLVAASLDRTLRTLGAASA